MISMTCSQIGCDAMKARRSVQAVWVTTAVAGASDRNVSDCTSRLLTRK